MSVILVALAILAIATYLPVISTPQPRRVLVWDPQTQQWRDACNPVRVVPLWECTPLEEWRTLPWSEALLLLYSGNVTFAMQFHNLTVLLTMKDGTVVFTHEPAIDQIFEAAGKCGEPCEGVVWGTE